ncbi:MAG: thioredoxin domain-containing protein [Prolixibacteraceae bacterium]|nr:thioredoxin domain-containing protein [Prolixibacteraceae bacterium]MDD4754636.1 thioredoxin domain-containing protein [Prolixibacteraceae bacterium]NLO03868.1 thiol reductase thioredoxin [Bacteroidales bacterium]
MRHLVLLIAIATLSLQSCNSSQAKDNDEQSDIKKTAVVESPVQDPVGQSGSVKLTKDVFLKQVWDYQSSPREWVYKGDKPALIDFYADWCGPCKIASPILDEISKEYSGKIYVYKIDTQVERELASVFGISGIPAFLYIPVDGKPVMMSGIARSKEDTKKMFIDNIEKYLLASK